MSGATCLLLGSAFGAKTIVRYLLRIAHLRAQASTVYPRTWFPSPTVSGHIAPWYRVLAPARQGEEPYVGRNQGASCRGHVTETMIGILLIVSCFDQRPVPQSGCNQPAAQDFDPDPPKRHSPKSSTRTCGDDEIVHYSGNFRTG